MKIWILVSNAASARIFSTEGRQTPLRLERQMIHVKSQAATTDQPGRGRTSSSGRGMFSMPSRSSGKDLEGEDFARQLSQVLREGLEKHQYERLALLAPPHFLGLLTKNISPEVNKHVLIRQGSDYTHVLTNLLPGLLADVLLAVDAEAPPAKMRPARQRRGLAKVEITVAEVGETLPPPDVAKMSELDVENQVKKAMGKREWSQDRLLELARQEGWALSKITSMFEDGQSFTRRRYHRHFLYSITSRGQSGSRTAR